MRPCKPILFWVDNGVDGCCLCKAGGKLLKSMTTGKCLCGKCIEYLAEAIEDDDSLIIDKLEKSITSMHQAINIPITDSPSEE